MYDISVEFPVPWVLCSHFHFKFRADHRNWALPFGYLYFMQRYMARFWPGVKAEALPFWVRVFSPKVLCESHLHSTIFPCMSWLASLTYHLLRSVCLTVCLCKLVQKDV